MTEFNKLYNLILQSVITEGIKEIQQQISKYTTPEITNTLISQLKTIPQESRNKKANLIAYFIKKGQNIKTINDSKIKTAFMILDKYNVNLNQFNSLNDLLEKYQKAVTEDFAKTYYSNPDNIKELFDKEVVTQNDTTIVTYKVDSTFKGLMAVRYIIDANWGYDANPWCLAKRVPRSNLIEKGNNDPMYVAKEMWRQYNNYEKRIAFQLVNGQYKLVAFCANENDKIRWWNRNDKPTRYIIDLNGNKIKTKKAKDLSSDERIKQLREILIYNQQTGLYDCDEDVKISNNMLIDHHLPFNFGDINGAFSCSNCEDLYTLQGAPEKCKSFYCNNCNNLTSLVGAPKEVEYTFDCSDCKNLPNLEGITQIVEYIDVARCSSLTSLIGCPKKIKGNLDCSKTAIKNLIGAPEYIGKYFDCKWCNNLQTLEGSPKEVGINFNCSYCQNLSSLNGLKYVGKRLQFYETKIETKFDDKAIYIYGQFNIEQIV